MPPSKTILSPLQADAWLTSVFGYDVYKATGLPEGGLPLERRAFFFAKVPAADVVRLSDFVRAGFHTVDMNLTFERQPDTSPWNAQGIEIVKSESQHAQAILEIAASAFEFSRFHLDPHISRSLANQVKREWVANTLNGKRGAGAYAAFRNSRLAGFLTVLVSESQGRRAGVIDLVGVSTDCQKQGIGEALVNHFVHVAGKEYDVLRVGTQAANIPSNRLYEKCGFRLADATYVLHAHVKDGKVL